MEHLLNNDKAIEEMRSRVRERLTSDISSQITAKKYEKGNSEYAEFSDDRSGSPYTISNALWFTGSLIMFRWAEVGEAILYDPFISRFYFNLGAFLILVNVAIALFCIVWLSMVKKVDSSQWEVLYPSAIPIATASFGLGALFVTIGFWPLWRYLTPVILFILFMGFVSFVAMIPAIGPLDQSSYKQTSKLQKHK